MQKLRENVFDLPKLRGREHVFIDRSDAGRVMAEMLEHFRGLNAIILAIPSGGLPVAEEIARQLELPMDVAVVSKITLPWNSEVGFGAVGFDGTVRLNDDLLPVSGRSQDESENGEAADIAKVARRVMDLRGDKPMSPLAGRMAIIVDDGLASGFTMEVAVGVVRKLGAGRVIVAVPTAHESAAARIATRADAVYCANIRPGAQFAVADAYRNWRDISESEAKAISRQFSRRAK